MRKPSFAISIHSVRAADVAVSAKAVGDTRWIVLDIDNHSFTLFTDTRADLELLCALFDVEAPPEAPPAGVEIVQLDDPEVLHNTLKNALGE